MFINVFVLNLKMQPLISSGLAYKLRSGALWRRRNSGVQNDANAASTAPAQSHEPHARHEGTYRPAATRALPHSPPHLSPSITITTLHLENTLTLTLTLPTHPYSVQFQSLKQSSNQNTRLKYSPNSSFQ